MFGCFLCIVAGQLFVCLSKHFLSSLVSAYIINIASNTEYGEYLPIFNFC